jgi:hypothetical protein
MPTDHIRQRAGCNVPWGSMEEMPGSVPAFVTHYFTPPRRPFLNLSDLPAHQLAEVMGDLAQERLNGATARVFGPRYMELRLRTEMKMRQLFIAAGGLPERTSPHYFVLGTSRWFRGLAANMKCIERNLCDLPEDATSFTYPDSFTAMGLGAEYGVHHQRRPYHEQVFRISQLSDVVGRYGMPPDEVGDYDGYADKPFEKYVEVQLWSDDPLKDVPELQAADPVR